jgi:Recombination endonuclease VII
MKEKAPNNQNAICLALNNIMKRSTLNRIKKGRLYLMTKVKKITTRICKVTGKEFQAVGKQTVSEEGRAIKDKETRDRNKNDPKWLRKRADHQMAYRAANLEEQREYIRQYMTTQTVMVDGVGYQGYNRTPQGKAYKQEWYRDVICSKVPKKPLTPEQNAALLKFQGGVCAISGERFHGTPHEDHDDLTGEVRGLLCVQCNTGLGFADHNPLLLRTVASLIEKGTLKRNHQINRVLGRFKTVEMLIKAADYLENPPYRQLCSLPANNNNEPPERDAA